MNHPLCISVGARRHSFEGRVEVKVKVKFTLEQATKAQRGSRSIAVLLLQSRRYMGCVINATPRPLYPPGKDPVPIVQVFEWATRPVWTHAGNLASTGIRTPESPGRSESTKSKFMNMTIDNSFVHETRQVSSKMADTPQLSCTFYPSTSTYLSV